MARKEGRRLYSQTSLITERSIDYAWFRQCTTECTYTSEKKLVEGPDTLTQSMKLAALYAIPPLPIAKLS